MIKLLLAISCFMPLYSVYLIKNVLNVVELYPVIHNNNNPSSPQDISNYVYNLSLSGLWSIMIVFGAIGILFFVLSYNKSYSKSKEKVKLISAKNITAEYYFTYFSLFIISFLTIDPTNYSQCVDIMILGGVFVLMMWVYIKNNLFFINPILNLLGFKSFAITYTKGTCDSTQTVGISLHQDTFETSVFSRINLCQKLQENIFITYSNQNFTVIPPDARK